MKLNKIKLNDCHICYRSYEKYYNFLLAGLGHICVHISYVNVLLPSEPFSQNMSLNTKVFNLNSQAGSS